MPRRILILGCLFYSTAFAASVRISGCCHEVYLGKTCFIIRLLALS